MTTAEAMTAFRLQEEWHQEEVQKTSALFPVPPGEIIPSKAAGARKRPATPTGRPAVVLTKTPTFPEKQKGDKPSSLELFATSKIKPRR